MFYLLVGILQNIYISVASPQHGEKAIAFDEIQVAISRHPSKPQNEYI